LSQSVARSVQECSEQEESSGQRCRKWSGTPSCGLMSTRHALVCTLPFLVLFSFLRYPSELVSISFFAVSHRCEYAYYPIFHLVYSVLSHIQSSEDTMIRRLARRHNRTMSFLLDKLQARMLLTIWAVLSFGSTLSFMDAACLHIFRLSRFDYVLLPEIESDQVVGPRCQRLLTNSR